MRWGGNVTRKGEKRNVYGLLMEKAGGKDDYEDQDDGGWIILGWILEKYI
jgi:hypothetical protein